MNKKEILRLRHFATLAMVYAVIAMALGVFYREFTKFSGFAGRTSLSFLHTHYFALGMVFFLIQMLLEKTFAFSSRNSGKFLLVYQLGLNITGLGFFLRGMSQVLGNELSRGMDASISGISGIGHILLGIGMGSLCFCRFGGRQTEPVPDRTRTARCGADVPQRAFSSLAGRKPIDPGNGIHYDGGRTWEEGLYAQQREQLPACSGRVYPRLGRRTGGRGGEIHRLALYRHTP